MFTREEMWSPYYHLAISSDKNHTLKVPVQVYSDFQAVFNQMGKQPLAFVQCLLAIQPVLNPILEDITAADLVEWLPLNVLEVHNQCKLVSD